MLNVSGLIGRAFGGGSKVGIILGARQVGKTTLVEHVLAGRRTFFLNFDVEIDKQRFWAAAAMPPGDGLRSFGNPAGLVVDEAQRLPEALCRRRCAAGDG